MTLKGETVTKVNKEYGKNVLRHCVMERLQLNVGHDESWSDSVYDRNWKVCKIDEITDMIRELSIIKEAIENITGVML